MATWRIDGTCNIGATIEPDGRLECGSADSFDDSSNYWGEDVNLEGRFDFEVEARNEQAAREKADEVLGDLIFYSNDNIEWEVSDVNIEEVERVSEPMPLATALETLREWVSGQDLEETLQDACESVLDNIEELAARNETQTALISGLRSEVEQLRNEVAVANGLRAVAEDALVKASETPFGPPAYGGQQPEEATPSEAPKEAEQQ